MCGNIKLPGPAHMKENGAGPLYIYVSSFWLHNRGAFWPLDLGLVIKTSMAFFSFAFLEL